MSIKIWVAGEEVAAADINEAFDGLLDDGDGSDGALAISSGTTDIDVGGVQVFIKNYTSISITGTGKLTFSNPHANGTLILFKCQGDVILTSSTTPNIDVSGVGADNGDGGAVGGNDGTDGTENTILLDTIFDGVNATEGLLGSAGAGGGSYHDGGAASVKENIWYEDDELRRALRSMVLRGINGAGGGGGGSGQQGTASVSGPAGNGGIGAGSLLITGTGALNFTGTIYSNGADGAAGSEGSGADRGGSGGGGGGAAGIVIVLCKEITANSGTITTDGGDGGDGSVGARSANNNDGGGGGSGGANAHNSGGAGGRGGYDSTHQADNGDAASPSGGAGGTGGGGSGTHGGGSSLGGGGGGGGGADGYSYIGVY
jgi:hypothetical protein